MRQILKGTLNVSVDVYIIDSTDGTPETGVLFNTAGMDMEYRRQGEVVVNITEVTLAALTTAHADGGFLEIGHGLYRLDLPDAACATGAGEFTVSIQGTVTGMIVLPQTIQLVDFDPNDAVRMGLTSLPSSGTLVAAGPTKAEMDTAHGLLATEAKQDIIDTNVDDIETAVITNAAGDDIAADIIALKAETVVIESQTDDIGVAGAGLIAIPATVDWLNGGRLDLLLDAIKAVTDLLPNAGALSDLATILADTNELQADWTNAGRLDAILDLILADTGELQTDWVNGGRLDLLIDAIKAVTDLLPDAGALNDLAIILADTADMQPRVVAIEVDTGTTLDGRIPAALIGGRMDSSIDNTGMESGAVDAIWAKAMTELGAVPGVTGTVLAALEWLFLLSRNKGTQTSSVKTLRNDADGADIATSTVSDNGTTFIRNEWS